MLPLTYNLLNDRNISSAHLQNYSIIIVQHLLPDTEEFISILLDTEINIIKVIGIEYSTKADVFDSISSKDVDVVNPPIDEIPTILLDSIKKYQANCNEQKLIIHEVGGYMADIYSEYQVLIDKLVCAVIEETKQGYWRYKALDNLNIPIIHISNAKLKDLEGTYVGRSAILTLRRILGDQKLFEQNTTIGLLGYGIIGKGVASALQESSKPFTCFDIDSLKQLEGMLDNVPFVSRKEILAKSKIIIGTTGSKAISEEELTLLADSVLLASVSSRNIEFPIDFIRKNGTQHKINQYLSEFKLKWGKRITIINEALPINFIFSSLPPFIADLMFSQIAQCMLNVINNNTKNGIHPISKIDETHLAENWINCYRDRDLNYTEFQHIN